MIATDLGLYGRGGEGGRDGKEVLAGQAQVPQSCSISDFSSVKVLIRSFVQHAISNRVKVVVMRNTLLRLSICDLAVSSEIVALALTHGCRSIKLGPGIVKPEAASSI